MQNTLLCYAFSIFQQEESGWRQAREWLDMPPAGLRTLGCEQLHLGSMALETGDFPPCVVEDTVADNP